MPITVSFPGGVAVDAVIGAHLVHTDQPVSAGGGGTGPSPFDLFLASIATCAGYYAVRFCTERKIPTEGLAVSMDWTRDPESKLVDSIDLALTLPERFPEKYAGAILRAVDLCTVKRHLAHPPGIRVTTTEAAVTGGRSAR